jgi:hypothetical protein
MRPSFVFVQSRHVGSFQVKKLEFEANLERLVGALNEKLQKDCVPKKPAEFEHFVIQSAKEIWNSDISHKAQDFPDIVIGQFGIEIKVTESDSWRSVANSISEGNRADHVTDIYVIFAKFGGVPEIKWQSYATAIMHVRTSHVPRFEIEIGNGSPLFESVDIPITYEKFAQLNMHEKMEHIRRYARSHLRHGEKLWWLEDVEFEGQTHSLPIAPRFYTNFSHSDKRMFRAEAALLSPRVVSGPRSKDKYNDAVAYLLTYRGVICSQARDLFTAGSVAGKERGGIYMQKSLIDIQDEMRTAAETLEPRLFNEYWQENAPVTRDGRLQRWLELADKYAGKEWMPSDCLFIKEQKT